MKNHSRLLINEPPLMFTPSLAVEVGLPEAIFLQQLHYWLEKSNNIKEGQRWVYNTYEEWQEQFPFWSASTIRRTIKSLEDKEILIVGKFNSLKIDNTKWYRIDYDTLNDFGRPSAQIEQTERSKWADHPTNMSRPLPEITTEITNTTTTTTGEEEKPPTRKETIIQYFERNLMIRTSPIHAQKLFAYLDDFDGQEEIVKRAIEIAADKNKRNFAFVEYILREWAMNNVTSLEAADLHEKEKFAKVGAGKKTSGSKYREFE